MLYGIGWKFSVINWCRYVSYGIVPGYVSVPVFVVLVAVIYLSVIIFSDYGYVFENDIIKFTSASVRIRFKSFNES